MPDAVVIGAGPNGLVAANHLADAGWDVQVLEAQSEPGGAVRSEALVEPGFVNDVCAAFFPLAAASPAIRSLELERWGLRWLHGRHVLAHVPADGPVALLSRQLDETAASLEGFAAGDGEAWRSLFDTWRRARPALLDAMVTPLPPVRAAFRLAAAAPDVAEPALLPVHELLQRHFRGAGAARLLTGNALHNDVPPGEVGSGFFGWLLTALGQDFGYPFPEGGAGRLTAALVRRLESRGGEVICGARVARVILRRGAAVGVRLSDGTEIPAARAVLADVDAPSLYLRLVGEELLPARIRFGLRRFRWDPATVKLDWTLDEPVPWTADGARLSPVVHLGADSPEEFQRWSRQLAAGLLPDSPFLLFGQYAAADPSRVPAGKETAWGYTRVPRGLHWSEAALEQLVGRIEQRIEDAAPGFRSRMRRRHVLTPEDLEARDSNLAGGSLNGGTARLRQQLILRPVPGLGRPETPFARLYLASSSAHPGGGVHGACGAIAARAALHAERSRKAALLGGAAALAAALTR